MTLRRPHVFLCAVAVLWTAGAGGASAARLDKEACDALRTEEAGLEAAGIKGDMQQGPEWAKTNLAPERLQQVARWIEIEEQLSFRCRVLAGPARKKGSPAKGAAGTASAAPADNAAPETAKVKPSVVRVKTAPKAALRRKSVSGGKSRRTAAQ